MPLFALSVLAFLSFARGEGRLGWWFGFFVLGLWASHRRVALVVAVALLAIAVAVWADRRRLRAGLVNAGVLVARARAGDPRSTTPSSRSGGCASAGPRSQRRAGHAAHIARRLGDVPRPDGRPGLVPGGRLARARRSRCGVSRLARRLRRGRTGGGRGRPPWGCDGGRPTRSRSTAWFQLGALVAMAVITSVFFTLVTNRPDQRVYGRYTDMVVPPVLAAGVGVGAQPAVARRWRPRPLSRSGCSAWPPSCCLAPHGTDDVRRELPDHPGGRDRLARAGHAGARRRGLPRRQRPRSWRSGCCPGCGAGPLALAGIVLVYAWPSCRCRSGSGRARATATGTARSRCRSIASATSTASRSRSTSSRRGEATVIQFWWLRRDDGAVGGRRAAPEPWAIAPIDSQRAIDAGGRPGVPRRTGPLGAVGAARPGAGPHGRGRPAAARGPAAPLPASARRGSITSATRRGVAAGGRAGRGRRCGCATSATSRGSTSTRTGGPVRCGSRPGGGRAPGEGGEPARAGPPAASGRSAGHPVARRGGRR